MATATARKHRKATLITKKAATARDMALGTLLVHRAQATILVSLRRGECFSKGSVVGCHGQNQAQTARI